MSAPTIGFHQGELAVQQRAGVRADAARLSGMLATPHLSGGFVGFLADRTFAVISARDDAGRLWISPLIGRPGFLRVLGDTTLHIASRPPADDPLHGIRAGQQAGLLTVEFARRRRLRINGTISAATEEGLTLEVDQAFGNCPQYIQQRVLEPVATAPGSAVRTGTELTPSDIELIREADTFLLGTTHPERGNDASHRGGSAGFVRVESPNSLWWPDYPGNNMFNSFGNLAVDPAAAMLFVDFGTGRTLHLSGTAELGWDETGRGDEGQTGRRVHFTVARIVAGGVIDLHADTVSAYPHNPPVTG